MTEVTVLETRLNGITENAAKVGMSFIHGFTAAHISIIPSQFIPYSFMYAGNIRYRFVITDTATLNKLPIINPATAPFFVLLRR